LPLWLLLWLSLMDAAPCPRWRSRNKRCDRGGICVAAHLEALADLTSVAR
jgi:hypothetical protein